MFELQPGYKTRIYYEPNGSSIYKFPSANIFTEMDLLLKLQANIVSNTASNAPDFQIFNAIESVTLIRNSSQIVWSLSGQALALLFTYKNGVAAGSNSTIAGSVANDVTGQHFLNCRFYPDDAVKKHDFGIDTRFADYELRIKWRDLTAVGTLFGTIGGTVTVTDSENYLELELKTLALRPHPQTGAPDALTNVAPLCMALREERNEVNSSNSQYEIDLPDMQSYRNVILYTTHVANTGQEVGENDVIRERVKLRDTQNRVKQERLAEMVREYTSQRWELGSNLPDGVYDLNLIQFGHLTDAIRATNVTDLRLGLDVVKQSNATYVRTIYVTQEQQVS